MRIISFHGLSIMGLKHIEKRHRFGNLGVSVFLPSISVPSVIDDTVCYPNFVFPHSKISRRTWYFSRFSYCVGRDREGKSCFWLAVLTDEEKEVITAYPVNGGLLFIR